MAHIKIQERLQIETLHNAGHKATYIALQLGRSKSCICREIKRNSVEGKYCHHLAQKRTDERRINAKQSILGDDNWTTVRSLLQQKWSLEQISGWLRNNPNVCFYVSDQWIYEYIKADRAQGGELYLNLRRAGKPYKTGGKKQYREKIKGRTPPRRERGKPAVEAPWRKPGISRHVEPFENTVRSRTNVTELRVTRASAA